MNNPRTICLAKVWESLTKPQWLLIHCLFFVMFQMSSLAQERQTLQVSFARDTSQPINIDLLYGQSRIIELDDEHDTLSYSIANVITVSSLTSKLIVVNGAGVGQVDLVVLKKRAAPSDPQRMLVFNVFVQKNLTLIDNKIKLLYPKENIELSQINDSIVLSGSVTRPEIAKDVETIITKAGIKDVVNLIKSPAAVTQQVELQVRIAEVNRSVAREIGAAYGIMNQFSPVYLNPGGAAPAPRANVAGGYSTSPTGLSRTNNLSLTGAVTNIFLGRPDLTSAFITALQTRGAFRTLAEPNIITSNKKEGKFLSGGSFPIPQITSASSGQSGFSVTYHDYGVKLVFTPTVVDENHIGIVMETEVSSIDRANGINTGGIDVPSFRVNSASTSLELADGQSFAIAGLLDNSENINYSLIPGLGNIPILGNLFKSKSFQRNETELMFLCTVKLKEPLNPDAIPRLPGTPATNLPAQPKANNSTSNSSGTELSPVPTLQPNNLALPSANLLEGMSGHDVPRKTPATEKVTAKATPKTDN